jgi:two-component system, NtrC family, response regulator HydG
MRTTTALLLRQQGYEVAEADSGEAALSRLLAEPFDVVLTDLKMAPLDGIAVLRGALEIAPSTQVLVMTGYGTVESAVEAMQLGAHDYLTKPFQESELLMRVQRALEKRQLIVDRGLFSDEFRERYKLDNLVGRSAPMRELLTRIVRVAPTDVTVLITGESGTGKELIARAIHVNSRRAERPFVPVNCAAIPETLLESELFGHERGAFTGAATTRKGAFEAAERGTLFLDEIGELPLQSQAKLLRVLEERRVVRLGANRSFPVEARVVAATNRDLQAEMKEGRFRADLYYRLSVHVLQVPPLRDHVSDIPEMAKGFLASISERFGIRPRKLSPEALDMLMRYDWSRNNVRELRNVLERMIIAADSEVLLPEHVPIEIQEETRPSGSAAGSRTFQDLRQEAERQIVAAALDRNGWHITQTAEELGLADHASLLKIMRRLNLRREDRGSST